MLAGHDQEYLRALWLVVTGIGGAIVVALIIVYRRAAARHELEEAERILAEHDQSS